MRRSRSCGVRGTEAKVILEVVIETEVSPEFGEGNGAEIRADGVAEALLDRLKAVGRRARARAVPRLPRRVLAGRRRRWGRARLALGMVRRELDHGGAGHEGQGLQDVVGGRDL